MGDTPKVTLPEIIGKIISSPLTHEPDKAEITVEGADELYRKIRIEDVLENSDGEEVKLEPGDHVDVTVQVTTGERVRDSSRKLFRVSARAVPFVSETTFADITLKT